MMRAHGFAAGLVATALSCCLWAGGAAAGAPEAAQVPTRTALAARTPLGGSWGTANQHEARAALSTAKLYLADYALRHGDGAEDDRALAERMIRYSDDAAADKLAAKYPGAIDAVAAEYGLTATSGGASWGMSWTSAADLADFLCTTTTSDPGSPILGWMRAAGAVAADGTVQDWGTARLPGVRGTKWGWADRGTAAEVASASFGDGFTIAAITYGSPDDQTTDVVTAATDIHDGPLGYR
ncbi:hypothetical protein ACWEQ0_14305 [Nocardia thailandica]